MSAETRIVDQHVHSETCFLQFFEDVSWRFRQRKIGGQDKRFDLVSPS